MLELFRRLVWFTTFTSVLVACNGTSTLSRGVPTDSVPPTLEISGAEGGRLSQSTRPDTLVLVFEDDFEAGDHHKWQDPDPLNGPQGTVPIDFATAERSRSGGIGYRFYGIERSDPLVQQYDLTDVDRISIKLLHWGPWAEGGPHVYSAWYYWPSEYAVHDAADKYTNIMQWKGRGHPDWNPTWIVAVDGHSGYEDRIVLHDWNGRMTGQVTHTPQPVVTVPKDRWFNLKVLYDPDWTNGTIKVWLDGVLIISRENVPTLVEGYQDRDLMWGVGNYGWAALGPDGDTAHGFFVDDVKVWKVSP